MQVLNLCSKLELDHSFKLIQLTPELLEVLEANKDDPNDTGLSFKSLDEQKSEVVLCSKEKTWLLRQKNHSNTVMLMHDYTPNLGTIDVPNDQLFGVDEPPTENLLGYSKCTFEYETKLIEGQLNLDRIPIYNEHDYELLEDDDDDGMFDDKNETIRDLNELMEVSPCSIAESLKQWYQVGGCSINGRLCILAKTFLSKLLNITLMSVMNQKLDLDDLSLSKTKIAIDIEMEVHNYKLEMIETLLNKFGSQTALKDSKDKRWKLHIPSIVEWYGLEALNKYATKESMPIDEFLIKWKSLFPPFFPSNIDIKMLRGNFYRPIDNHIQYISRNILPNEPKARFKTLFKLQTTWEFDDIAPFITELNTRGIKLENFMMKFAKRRKTVGENRKPIVLITSRD